MLRIDSLAQSGAIPKCSGTDGSTSYKLFQIKDMSSSRLAAFHVCEVLQTGRVARLSYSFCKAQRSKRHAMISVMSMMSTISVVSVNWLIQSIPFISFAGGLSFEDSKHDDDGNDFDANYNDHSNDFHAAHNDDSNFCCRISGQTLICTDFTTRFTS